MLCRASKLWLEDELKELEELENEDEELLLEDELEKELEELENDELED